MNRRPARRIPPSRDALNPRRWVSCSRRAIHRPSGANRCGSRRSHITENVRAPASAASLAPQIMVGRGLQAWSPASAGSSAQRRPAFESGRRLGDRQIGAGIWRTRYLRTTDEVVDPIRQQNGHVRGGQLSYFAQASSVLHPGRRQTSGRLDEARRRAKDLLRAICVDGHAAVSRVGGGTHDGAHCPCPVPPCHSAFAP